MGFIRGILITFFSIILLIFLFLMNFSLTVSLSLNHDTLQPALKSSAITILRDFLGNQSIFSETDQAYIQNYCIINKEYKLDYENYNFTFPCEIIEQGTDSIISYGAENFVDQIYYTEYNCEFWQCVKDSIANSSIPFVLFSEKAREYWNQKFILLAALSFVIFALIFLISKKRSTTFIVTGILLIISALPFRKLDWALKFINKRFSSIFSVFFTKAHLVFIIILIIGLALIVAGILCKMFGWKMKFHKDEEDSKDKKEEIQKKQKKKSSN